MTLKITPGPFGSQMRFTTADIELTGLAGAIVDAASLIPAGATPVGVSSRVTSAITGATGFDFGTPADPDQFGANLAVALDSTSDNRDWTVAAWPLFTVATTVRVTAVGPNFVGGNLRIVVVYMANMAPTS